jgi:hypothetical protein
MVDKPTPPGTDHGADRVTDPAEEYVPYDDLVAGRGDSDVEADYVDQGLGGVAGMELNQYSPMGEVGASARIYGSSALHRLGWRRNVMLGLIVGPIGAIVAAALVNAAL